MNAHYFDRIDTEEKAYFLGLLFADGTHIESCNRITLELQQQDAILVERLSLALLGNIRTTKRLRNTACLGKIIKNKTQVGVSVSNAHLSTALKQKGLRARKSFACEMPDLDERLISHFVRGYFDGDGCLSGRIYKNVKRWTISILSSQSMCRSIVAKLQNHVGLSAPIHKRGNIHEIIVSGNRKVCAVMDWLYRDSSIRLERKYARYEELKHHIECVKSKPRYSKHTGISFDKQRNKWTAVVRTNKHPVFVGRFSTEQQAVSARTKASLCASHELLKKHQEV